MLNAQLYLLVILIMAYTSLAQDDDPCTKYTGQYTYYQKQAVEMTYSDFRDSNVKAIKIRDDIENPTTLTSFFMGRNKVNCPLYNYNYRRCVEEKIHYFDLSNGSLQFINQNAFSSISICLQYLIFRNNQISKLNSIAFASLNNLKYLDLSHNRIKLFDMYLLDGIYLDYLNVSYNQVEVVVADQLINIRTVDLSHNNISEFTTNIDIVELSNIDNSTKIAYLNLANNNLVLIDLNKVVQLQHLDVSINRLATVQDAIKDADQLEVLIASHNQINSFSISNFIYLRIVDLSYNQIEFINVTALPHLETLNLANNKIVLQPYMFRNLRSLESWNLNLDGNNFNLIPLQTFYDLDTLKSLSLANNELDYFDFGSFAGLINLTYLDLSYNKINDLQSDKLMDLNELQILLLDGNYINQSNFNIIDIKIKMSHLHTIGLSNMQWSCEQLAIAKLQLRRIGVNLKHTYNATQLSYTVDGINCVPQSVRNYSVINMYNRILKTRNEKIGNNVTTSTTIAPLGTMSEEVSDELPLVARVNVGNVQQYHNTFLQRIENIMKGETSDIKQKLEKLENSTMQVLDKLENIERQLLNHNEYESRDDSTGNPWPFFTSTSRETTDSGWIEV